MLRVTAVFALILLFFSTFAQAQESQRARSIYEQHSNSVVLLLARDSSGKDVALGSAFWVAPKLLVTNAHVVDAGKIFVQLGPVRLPCTIVAIDHKTDLATLSVDVEIDSAPLKLSTVIPKPGDPVFVIGNPEGLERAISQGIVSGIRKLEDQEIIQITAPISHGSSGGPVFNDKGEVIGVTVGMLQSGQNLNFAIPVRYVADLLTSKHNATGGDSLAATLAQLQQAQEELNKLTYSDSPNSEYQKNVANVKALARAAINEAGTDAAVQIKISELLLWTDSDSAVDAARRACSVKPTVEAHLALVKALQFKGFGSNDTERPKILAEAESHAGSAVYLSTKTPRFDALYALGDVQEDRGEFVSSEQNLKRALLLSSTTDQKADVYRSLARVCASEGAAKESEQWFQKLVAAGQDRAWDWHQEGMRLASVQRYRECGDAYSKAHEKGMTHDICIAATAYYLSDHDDSTLAASRLCISEETGKADRESDLADAHLYIATVLNKRGVYTEALSHAKEATVLNTKSAASYDALAEALTGLQRFHEAVEASEQAIRLSDGGVSIYHFTLGYAYFQMENWQLARQSYEKAAELGPTSPAPAYNLALCYLKQRYYLDAAHWFEEYLRRYPNAPDRADVLTRIQALKK